MQWTKTPIVVMDMVEGKWEFPKKVKEFDDDSEPLTSEQYVYDRAGIRIEKFCKSKGTKDVEGEEYRIVEEILRGELDVHARVEFQESERHECRWHISYCGEDYIGDFDDVVEFIYSFGRTKVNKDRMKQALGAIIAQLDIPTHDVYPAVGFFYDKAAKKVKCANRREEVFPITDAQEVYLRRFDELIKVVDKEKEMKVLDASVDFINSMPKKNRFAALIARAFSFVAPLGYVSKQTVLGVFPYLYLFGQKGCSKTHIGMTASTYLFGELEPLTSDAIDSPFRLGLEFTATTNPRLVDDGEDVFKKNVATFKAAATSTVATKRGNKDKTLDTYRAFCPFIFTSNNIPIPPEEDSGGALMDRLLVVECFAGTDFEKELYQKSFTMLSAQGSALGKVIYEALAEEMKDGPDKFVSEIMRIAALFQEEDMNISLRRSYCLAYVVWGIKKYYEVLEKNGRLPPIPYQHEKTIIKEIRNIFQENARVNELANLINFMDFVFGATRFEEQDMARASVYWGMKGADAAVIITSNTLKRYRQQYNLQKSPYSDLPSLSEDFKKIGLDLPPTAHKDERDTLRWGIKVPQDGYYKALELLTGNGG